MHWTVAAPFFTEENLHTARWLDDFVPEGDHTFVKIPRRDPLAHQSWHSRASRTTSFLEWLNHWNQSGEAWRITQGGIITVFPQLANMVGWRKRASHKDVPVVAWCFNVGALYPGLKQMLARTGLQDIDRFIVHSRRECETVSHWLNQPKDKFAFIPLQSTAIPVVESEETERPFVLAMGSAHRDYPTFFSAVEKLRVRTIVVAGQHALDGLSIPSNVEVRSGLTPNECHRLAQRARVNVVPLMDHVTGAGQVTIVEAMRMGRAIVATRCTGSEDYLQHGKTGLLARPGSVDELGDRIAQLWSDQALRDSLGQEAGQYAEKYCSDEAAGSRLSKILAQF